MVGSQGGSSPVFIALCNLRWPRSALFLAALAVFMSFMKGSPSAPQCGFSNMACRILDHHGVEYASRNVLASDELRNGIKAFSAWPTIPQLYVKGEFVGGSDIMMSMHQSGELAELFQDVKKA